LDANDWLSVQVHPDDAYGLAHEGELGKTECWYIIAADPDAEIIYGHHAKDKAELRAMIEAETGHLLTKVKVKAGDFFYVPSGTMHAIGKGIMILETSNHLIRLTVSMILIGKMTKAICVSCILINLLMC
jgi:mannose-6-phosphate isomerase